MLSQPIISAKGLEKSYPGVTQITVLKGIDLTIWPGDRIAITGRSGAGKSTLLHLLGTLERPSNGEILFEGKDVFSYSDSKLSSYRNEKIGFVFQFHYLMLEFTALENVMIPLLISGEKSSVARTLASALLSQVGLEGRLHHRPNQLSGGEQQRVAIARALVRRPKLLLTDEMTGNLDPHTGEMVLRLIQSLHREYQMAQILVTHDEEIANNCPTVYRLEEGRLLARTSVALPS